MRGRKRRLSSITAKERSVAGEERGDIEENEDGGGRDAALHENRETKIIRSRLDVVSRVKMDLMFLGGGLASSFNSDVSP
jgi:hypothetical protein